MICSEKFAEKNFLNCFRNNKVGVFGSDFIDFLVKERKEKRGELFLRKVLANDTKLDGNVEWLTTAF